MHHSDEEYYYSSSIDEYSESDGGDDEPTPYWDIVRHGKQYASYRFVIVHPPDGTSNEEEDHPQDQTTDASSVMIILPRRPPDDLWGCRLRASPPPPPPEEISSTAPVVDNTPAWQSNRLQQSLGITIPPPPPPQPIPDEEEEEWSVIRRNKRSSLLRTNIAPSLRPPTTRSEDRKDLLCKLSHRNSSCQRAHSLAEWRPKECRRNGCRQTNCQMLHPATEDRTALLMRLITINGTFYHQHAQDFVRLYTRTQRPPPHPRRGRGGRGGRR